MVLYIYLTLKDPRGGGILDFPQTGFGLKNVMPDCLEAAWKSRVSKKFKNVKT